MDTRTCKLCGEDKPLEQFNKMKGRSDGLDARCNPCLKRYKALLYQLHKQAPEKPDKCPLCHKDPGNGKKGWHLDHSHEDGTIRGWLCASCNHKIEWYITNKDDIRTYLNETIN